MTLAAGLLLGGCVAQDRGGLSSSGGSWISGPIWTPGGNSASDAGSAADASDAAAPKLAVPEGTCPSTLEELSEQVLMPACAGSQCHSAAEHVAGLDLETLETLETELVGVPSSLCEGETRVIPGDAWSSLLVTKVEGSSECGSAMPGDGRVLPVGTVACIAALVEQLDTESCETCGAEACLDLTRDRMNCGECGNVCTAGSSCVQGACTCDDEALSLCGKSCVDTQSEGAHCGECGNDCGAQFCLDGSCMEGCGELTACGNSCVDTQSDAQNCGECGVVCGTGRQCQQGQCVCGGQIVSFSNDVQPIFTTSCNAKGCHDSSRRGVSGGSGRDRVVSYLDLTQGKSWASLFATSNPCGQLVVPGNPDSSVLVGKLTGDELCDGAQMPLGDDPLPQASIDTIARWICQGALNN